MLVFCFNQTSLFREWAFFLFTSPTQLYIENWRLWYTNTFFICSNYIWLCFKICSQSWCEFCVVNEFFLCKLISFEIEESSLLFEAIRIEDKWAYWSICFFTNRFEAFVELEIFITFIYHELLAFNELKWFDSSPLKRVCIASSLNFFLLITAWWRTFFCLNNPVNRKAHLSHLYDFNIRSIDI